MRHWFRNEFEPCPIRSTKAKTEIIFAIWNSMRFFAGAANSSLLKIARHDQPNDTPPRGNDSVLASFLEAASEAEASLHLTDLLSLHAMPVIEQILRAKQT